MLHSTLTSYSRLALPAALAVLLLLGASSAEAEVAWMKDTLTAAVYKGPNTGKAIGGIKTGEKVTIIDRAEGWTKVRLPDGKEGWVKRGYLKPQPPAMIRLAQLESKHEATKDQLGQEIASLRAKLEKITGEATDLQAVKNELGSESSAQKAELERLSAENIKLKARIEAGDRTPMMVKGAAILAAGMFLQLLLGSFVSWRTGRRPTSRVRL